MGRATLLQQMLPFVRQTGAQEEHRGMTGLSWQATLHHWHKSSIPGILGRHTSAAVH